MREKIAVICEYNPFHLGHKYQLEQIKIQNPDSDIICIMSGNICQRGEFALLDKYGRAKAAIDNGADAVFELLYPYSGSTAEIFARSGVYVAYRLGVSKLYFGTKELDIQKINSIADIMEKREYEEFISEELKNKSQTYLSAKEKALKYFGVNIPKDPNDILALEYVKAIKEGKYEIEPHAIKRTGADYNDNSECEIMSAGAIREHYYKNKKFISVPKNAENLYSDEHKNGYILNFDMYLDFIYRYVLVSREINWKNVFDSNEALVNFIYNTAEKSTSSKEFFKNLSSKNFTSSRIKRTILYSVFGIDNIDCTPPATTLLACNENGRRIVREINKSDPDFILTKIADYKNMSPAAVRAYETNLKADKIYNTLLYSPKSTKDVYKTKIYLKE